MIITISGADFSLSNIGTLSTWTVSKSIGAGAEHNIPSYVDKNSAFNYEITLKDGYTFGTYSVTMGGQTITPTVTETSMTINIASVTGAIRIEVKTINSSTGEPEEPEQPGTGGGSGTINAGLTLHQGYVDNKTVNDELNTRVKSDMLQGPYTIELNSGYLIRAIYEYNTTSVSNGGTAIVTSADQKTSYTYSGNKYTYITFCKTDATASISPTENIVKTYTINEYTPDTPDTPDTPETTDKITVNGIDIKLGQILGTSLKADNTARAYTVNTINDKTSLATTGDFVMIPLYDADDTLSNGSGTFYTGSDGKFNTSSSGSLSYYSTINVADLATAAPNTNLRVMFKRNDGKTINLSELQSSLTII